MVTKEKIMKQISPTLLKGKITELRCELWFLEKGFLVSFPDLPYQYDIIVDLGMELIKVQIKTCRFDGTGLVFNTSSVTHNQSGYTKRIYSAKAVDYFMTYYDNNCYLIPFEKCGTKQKKLRIEPTKNNQTKGIDFAKDFLAEKILEERIKNIE